MRAVFYLDKRSVNDATVFYISILEDCLKSLGFDDIIFAYDIKSVVKPDLIVTISSINFVKAKLRYPFTPTISWRQGASFEEALMTRAPYKWVPFYICEFITLHCADLLLFISDKMNEYYRHKFLYRGTNFIIMPCYNLPLGDFMNDGRYNKPTFVYAGGINKWQSIDEMMDTYAIIEKELPNASLSIYAKNTEYIMTQANKRGIKNISVKYVPLDQLQGEMEQYKYGFLLRQKNWVNYVATPTKMNSYLAAHLIPIFSNGVSDFEKNIDLGKYTILADTPLSPHDIARKILTFEKHTHDFDEYGKIVSDLFDKHYNTTKYKDLIIRRIKECKRIKV